MKTNIIFFLLLMMCIVSCSKDSPANANSNNTTGVGGSLARFTIVGNYLYIADVSQLRVFDISNSGAPAEKSPVYVGWGIETLFACNNDLFIGSSTGMFVYSLSNPANPALLGQVQHFRSCDPVVANDSFAYVTLRGGTACGPATDGLYIYNIQNITNPTLIKGVEMSTPAGLALNNHTVYVCRQADGMSVVDVTTATAPVVKTTITDAYFEDAIVYDQLLICYVSTGLQLYDISIADHPVFINTVTN